jgi:hypothetical protein
MKYSTPQTLLPKDFQAHLFGHRCSAKSSLPLKAVGLQCPVPSHAGRRPASWSGRRGGQDQARAAARHDRSPARLKYNVAYLLAERRQRTPCEFVRSKALAGHPDFHF